MTLVELYAGTQINFLGDSRPPVGLSANVTVMVADADLAPHPESGGVFMPRGGVAFTTRELVIPDRTPLPAGGAITVLAGSAVGRLAEIADDRSASARRRGLVLGVVGTLLAVVIVNRLSKRA